jgi:hypothetical protein
MDSNLYALEKQVESRLEDARVAGQRAALYASVRGDRPGFWKRAAALVAVRPNLRFRRMSAGPSRI